MINLDHPWFDEMKGPHPLPVVQQSIDFIQGMRSELRAAREVIEHARKPAEMFYDQPNAQGPKYPKLREAINKYNEVTRD